MKADMNSFRWLAALFAPIALFVLPIHASAQAVVTDDAYVMTTGSANFGKHPDLRVSRGRTTYVKFQLPTLPPGANASTIQRATLQLFLGTVTAPGRLDVFAVQDAWDESTLTPGTAPPPAELITTTDVIPVDAQSHFLMIDVTSLVRQWIGDGSGRNAFPNQGVAISARLDGVDAADLAFDSKENSQTSHEPQLLLQLTATDGTPRVTEVSADAPIFVDGGTTTPHLTLGTVSAANGGTGLASPGAAGSFLRSTGAGWASAPLSSGDVPAGSGSYIQNGTVPQASSNFNVTGVGAASVLDAATQFNLTGARVLANPGNSNLYVGRNTGSVSTGAANTFVGNNAGSQNTTAIRNTFLGADAGRFTTSGGQNTFIGTDAGKFTAGTFDNVFIGDSAGANSTGAANTFVGAFAGTANTSGIRNVFMGVESGLANTTGGSNTFVGTESGKLNTTGQANAYFGDLSGIIGTTASRNAFFGFSSGEHVDGGSDNAFFGMFSGDHTTNGNRNTLIGRSAAFQNTNGDDNTFLGSFADFTTPNDTGSGNTAIGAGARIVGNISNAAAIGSHAQASRTGAVVLGSIKGVNDSDQDSAVGIGTTNPQEKLDVIGGNIYIGSNGRGLILRSPDGSVCRQLSIDNNGTLLASPVVCPAVLIQ